MSLLLAIDQETTSTRACFGLVMAGLDPAIHSATATLLKQGNDFGPALCWCPDQARA